MNKDDTPSCIDLGEAQSLSVLSIKPELEENLNHMVSCTKERGTGSLGNLDTCYGTALDNSFVLEPSAFTLPNTTHRLFLPNQEGTHSLPLPRLQSTNKPVTNTNSEKAVEPLRKTHSSVSLTSIPDGLCHDIWAGSLILRRTAKPNLENERHRENSLRLSILEARNLPSKRRYYCDICLDRTLYARTTSKTATSGIFWAEDFDLNNLPNVSVMTISLYKESDSGCKELRRFGTARMSAKKLRKLQNQLIGFVTVPMSEISDRNNVQTWLTLQPPADSTVRDTTLLNLASVGLVPSARNPMDDATRVDGVGAVLQSSESFTSLNTKQLGGNSHHTDQRTLPQIRIRARYRSVDVLPHRDYWALKAFLLEHSLLLATWLDSVLPVKTKEEVASSLVGLHECNGTLVTFLTDLVVKEVAQLDNDSMAFRSNTMATKAVECFVKLVGSTYLHNLLYRLVQNILACLTAWEVNPEKLSNSSANALSGSLTVSDTAAYAKSNELALPTRPAPGTLKANQIQLLQHLSMVWRAIQASLPRFPSTLIRVFSSFRSALEPSRGAEFCDNLISGCIFLRLICPALLSPSLFGLVSAFPSEPWCQRNLTLLAKSLQSLANFTTFDDKEPYMRFLNGYVSAQMPSMRAFIRNISNWATVSGRTDDPDTIEGFRDVVDEGFELANLHLLLTEHLNQTEEFTLAKSNQHLEVINEKTNNGSMDAGLPEALSPLPCLLEDLTRRLDSPSTTGTTRSLTRYNNSNAGSVTHRQLVDRLHATTLPAKHRKRADGTDSLARLLQSDTQLTSTDSGSNLYAYHSASSLTKPVPYYTLHQNPGYHRPSDSGTKPGPGGALSILAVDESFENVDTQSGGMVQPNIGPARVNPNDYDEPYAGVHSDSDGENEARHEVNGSVKVPDIARKQTDKKCEAALSYGSNSDLQMASSGSKTCMVSDTSEDPIYDIVPTSDDSSTDDIVDANEAYLREMQTAKLVVEAAGDPPARCPSLGALLNEDRCFKPVQPVGDTPADSVSSFDDNFSVTESDKSTGLGRPGMHVERPNTIRLEQATKTSLSPRLLPKQVTTASMVLTTPSSPTRPVESPTVNIQHVPNVIHSEFNGCLTNPGTQQVTGVDTSSYDHINSRSKLDLPSIPTERVVNSIGNGNLLVPGIGKRTPVARANSDLDAYKDAVWTSHTSSSNSLTSMQGIMSSPESLMKTSPELLHSEVVHLRQQLQLSREDAARAANRLSQQEAELAHLRQSLEQMRTKLATVETAVVAPVQSTIRQPPANLSSPPRNQLSAFPVNGPHVGRMNYCAKPIVDSKKAKTSVPMSSTTTFEELDVAMAKLEREQNELMREQVRIRARLAASRPVTTTTAATTSTSPQLVHPSPNPKSTILSVKNSKLAAVGTKSPLSSHLVTGHPTRSTGVSQPNVASSSVQYGPRVRHGPPPKPRNDNSPRYAY